MYKTDANTTVENIDYEHVELSGAGETWQLEHVWMPIAAPHSPIYKSIHEPFDALHLREARLPVDLGPINTKAIHSCPRVLRLTIKPKGKTEVRVPQELRPVLPLIKRLLHYEYLINENLKDFEVHVTLDSSVVEKGHTHRYPGWHTDGFQGAKFTQKLVCEHSYIAASAPGVEICAQPFFVDHLDPALYNAFKAFDQQALPQNIYRARPNHVYLLDPYVVHRTPVCKKATTRAFFRLTIANKELPIEYNTLNPMWHQKRHPAKLDIRDILSPPDYPIPYGHYGLSHPTAANRGQLPTTTHLASACPPPIQPPRRQSNLSLGTITKIQRKSIPTVQPKSPIYTQLHQPFHTDHYTHARPPIDLGNTDTTEFENLPGVLRLIIKWAGAKTLHLPSELHALHPLLTRLLTYDRAINTNFTDMFAHLTLDNQPVAAHTTQRYPGFHGDDLQGASFKKKTLVAHSYLITTDPATEICLQPFFLTHLDDSFESLYKEFDKQAKPENVYALRPNHIYLFDPYVVHRSPHVATQTSRVFLRLTLSPKKMLLPGATTNPAFADRPDPKYKFSTNELLTQTPSDRSVPYEFYGLMSEDGAKMSPALTNRS